MVFGIEFDADVVAVEVAGGDERRAGAAEGVENDAAGFREGGDKRLQNADKEGYDPRTFTREQLQEFRDMYISVTHSLLYYL